MTAFFLARLKAFFATLAAGLTPVIIKAVETATTFDIPTQYELAIAAAVTGWVVNYTTNKPA